MKNSIEHRNILKVVGSFVSLLIGSGFATGQETMQFFSAFGVKGIAGIGIVLILLSYLTFNFIKLGKEKNITKSNELFQYYFGKKIGSLLGWYTLFFIILIFIVMVAGAGSALEESYGVPKLLGSGLLVMIVCLAILRGLDKLTNITGVVGPIIIFLTIFIALSSLVNSSGGVVVGSEIVQFFDLYSASKNWWSSGFLYVGLNVIGIASFAPSLGKLLKNKDEIIIVSILGPGLFALSLSLVSLAIISNIVLVSLSEIPNLVLATRISNVFNSLFSLIIFISIFASSTSLLWSVVTRFTEESTKEYKILTLVLGIIGYIGGNLLPFSRLVNLIYPVVGVVGTVILMGIVAKDIRTRVKVKEIEVEIN